MKFFAVSRRREVNGRFAGVTIVSIAPEYFADFYSRLPSNERSNSLLLRRDGTVLARYPDPPGAPPKLPENSAFDRAMRVQPERGMFVNVSSFDGVERIFAYRKLPRHHVYVATSFAHSTVTRNWVLDVGSHLIFGIPATVAMFGLGLMALRRSQRLHAGGSAAARPPRWRSAKRRRWRRSAGSPAASRTISTTCSPSSSATSISRCGG